MRQLKHNITKSTSANKSSNYNCFAVTLSLIILLATGCGTQEKKMRYKWKAGDIDPTQLKAINTLGPSTTVSMVNGNEDDHEELILGLAYPNVFAVNLHDVCTSKYELADAMITQFSMELEAPGVIINDNALKQIQISVIDVECVVIDPGGNRTDINLTVTAGNEYSREIAAAGFGKFSFVDSVTPAHNNAIAQAVIEILNDPKIIAYLKN